MKSMKSRMFGWFSIIIWCLVPYAVWWFFPYRKGATALENAEVNHNIFIGACLFNLVIGIYLYKIIRIKGNYVYVIGILNPFLKTKKINISEIEKITIWDNNVSGMTTMIFALSEEREIKFNCIIYWIDRKRMKKAFAERGMNLYDSPSPADKADTR